MKKFFAIPLCVSILFVILTASAFAADAQDSSSIEFTEGTYNITAGDEITIYLTTESPNAIEWTLSDNSIVEMVRSNTRTAVVKGIGEGDATIIARDEVGHEAKCSVKVALQKIGIKPDKLTLGLGCTGQIELTEGKGIKWISENSDIVKIPYAYSRDSVSIEGVGLGTTKITAIDSYGASTSCTVTVVESYLNLEKNSVEMNLNSTWSDGIKVLAGSVAKVESSDPGVVSAFYSPSFRGIVLRTGGKVGNAVVTVTEKAGAKEAINVTTIKPTGGEEKVYLDARKGGTFDLPQNKWTSVKTFDPYDIYSENDRNYPDDYYEDDEDDEYTFNGDPNAFFLKIKAKKTGTLKLNVTYQDINQSNYEDGSWIWLCNSKKKRISYCWQSYYEEDPVAVFGVKKGNTYYIKFAYNPNAIINVKASNKSYNHSYGTIKNKAKTVKRNKVKKGVFIAGANSPRWYKIKLNKSQKIRVTFRGDILSNSEDYDEIDLWMKIYSLEGKNMTYYAKKKKLPAGTYYIKVYTRSKLSTGSFYFKWK